MKKKTVKTMAIAMSAWMMLGSLVGCGSAESGSTEKEGSALAGAVSLAGSTSMEKLCEAMSEGFMEAYPDITVIVEYTGSGAGIESLTQGSIDIGNASRGLKDGEIEKGAVLAKVASTPGAIGYVSLDVVDNTVTAVALNSAPANEESILAGEYLLSRPFVMATMGEIAEQNELVQTWFDYIASEEGQSIIADLGLILPQ